MNDKVFYETLVAAKTGDANAMSSILKLLKLRTPKKPNFLADFAK